MLPRTILASMIMAATIGCTAPDAKAAGTWSAAIGARMSTAGASSDVRLVSRWDHHPRRHMRYRLPPDIFKPRCWVNQWGDLHCPYARRVRHFERRRCTVDPWGRLVCPY